MCFCARGFHKQRNNGGFTFNGRMRGFLVDTNHFEYKLFQAQRFSGLYPLNIETHAVAGPCACHRVTPTRSIRSMVDLYLSIGGPRCACVAGPCACHPVAPMRSIRSMHVGYIFTNRGPPLCMSPRGRPL